MGTVEIAGNEPRIINIIKKEIKMQHIPGQTEEQADTDTSRLELNELYEKQAEVNEMLGTLGITQNHEIPLNDWEHEVLVRMLEDYKQAMQIKTDQARTIRHLRHRIADLNRQLEISREEQQAAEELAAALIEGR